MSRDVEITLIMQVKDGVMIPRIPELPANIPAPREGTILMEFRPRAGAGDTRRPYKYLQSTQLVPTGAVRLVDKTPANINGREVS